MCSLLSSTLICLSLLIFFLQHKLGHKYALSEHYICNVPEVLLKIIGYWHNKLCERRKKEEAKNKTCLNISLGDV